MKTTSVISIFFLFCLFVDVFGQLAGGYSNMNKHSEYFRDLKTDLQKSNLSGVLNNQVIVKRVEEAQRQVVAGTNYKILSKIEVNGQLKSCCIKAFRSLDGDFSVKCADCNCKYPTSECFQ